MVTIRQGSYDEALDGITAAGYKLSRLLTVLSYLKTKDPLMELALIEAAAPGSLKFDPEKSCLILDPLISQDPGLKLSAGEGSGANKDEMLWNSVNQTAKSQAEDGSPAAA